MTNCTISNNTVKKVAESTSSTSRTARGGGIFLNGGGTITHSTIAYNNVVKGTNSTGPNQGGGLYALAYYATDIRNTVIANNVAPLSNDLWTDYTITNGNNVIGDGTGGSIANGQDGNKVGTTASPLDVKLGQLAENGGDTRTIALLAGSPAIDAGDATAPTTDQRGVARQGVADVGAFEYVTPVPTFAKSPKARVAAGGTAGTLAANAAIADASALTYAWKLIGKPAHASDPIVADPATASTAVTYAKAGTYTFRITVSDASGNAIVKRVTAVVSAVATSVHIKQHQRTLSSAAPTRMRAYVADQFGNALLAQPAIAWSLVEGAGAIDASSGVYTPTKVRYSHLVFKATAGTATGTAGNRLKRQG